MVHTAYHVTLHCLIPYSPKMKMKIALSDDTAGCVFFFIFFVDSSSLGVLYGMLTRSY